MGNENAHIQPLCFGELFLFSPMEQFEYQGKNENSKHMSLTFSMLQWWLVHASESMFLFVSSCCLSFFLFFFYPHGCFSLWACMYGFCNFAALICVPMCFCEFTNLSELQSFTWCTVICCVIRINNNNQKIIINNLRNSNTKIAKLKCPCNKIFHIPGWTVWGWGKNWDIILFFPL